MIAGNHLHVSGMIGTDGDLEFAERGDPDRDHPRTPQPGAHHRRLRRPAADVVKAEVHLTDMADFAAMNEAYLEFVGDDPPARITTGTTALALGALVEIDCIAYRDEGWAAPT